MNNADSYLRLRLAARALIEWKTPITAGEYQRVLTDLLKLHPSAALWGLTPDKELLKLDERGTVLWYLSETLDTKVVSKVNSFSTQPSQYVSQYIKRFHIVAGEGLLNYCILGNNAKKTTWPGGPTKPQVVDTIFEALASKDERKKSLGFASLVSILIPLDDIQNEIIRNMMNCVNSSSTTSQRLAFLRQKSRVRIILFSLLLLQVLLVRFSLLLASFKSIYLSKIILFIINLPLMALTIEIFQVLYQRDKNFRSLFLKYSFSIETISKEWNRQVNKNLAPGVFLDSIGNILSSNPKLLVSLLKTKSKEPWREIALTLTKNATSDVIKNVLELIRDPEIDYSMREQVFRWLCSVKIISAD